MLAGGLDIFARKARFNTDSTHVMKASKEGVTFIAQQFYEMAIFLGKQQLVLLWKSLHVHWNYKMVVGFGQFLNSSSKKMVGSTGRREHKSGEGRRRVILWQLCTLCLC